VPADDEEEQENPFAQTTFRQVDTEQADVDIDGLNFEEEIFSKNPVRASILVEGSSSAQQDE
jgi:hypothetical protein